MDRRYVAQWDWVENSFMVWDRFAGAPSGPYRYPTYDVADGYANDLEAQRHES